MLEQVTMVLQAFIDERKETAAKVVELQARFVAAETDAVKRDLTIEIVQAEAKRVTWDQAIRALSVAIEV